MSRYLTLSPRNQFAFTCPVFNADTKMAACMALREAVWKGLPIEKRRGCQAAMKCGMCPAAQVVSRISFSARNKPVSDDYGSNKPKKGRLRADILERIVNVLPRQQIITSMSVPEVEVTLLMTARDRIADQLKTAPGERTGAEIVAPQGRALSKTSRKAKPAQNSNINEAARTGDMAAALNAA